MSDMQLAVLDHTIQLMNIWLKKMMVEHHFETRHDAYGALRAVLHALRDRLTPEQAVHFGAQLPILVRGVYYEGWRIAGKPPAIGRWTNLSYASPPSFRRKSRETRSA